MPASRRLFFLRHGLADWPDWTGDDADRPLTHEGKLRLQREADFMDQLGLAFDLILTSPLLRASQTAAIVAERLGLGDQEGVGALPQDTWDTTVQIMLDAGII